MNNSRAIQIFQVSNQLSTLIIGVLLAKFLSTSQVGSYEVILLASVFWGSFVFQGLSQAYLRKEVVRNSGESHFNFMLVLTCILWLLLGLVYLLRHTIFALIGDYQSEEWLVGLLIYAGTMIPSYFVAYLFMLSNRTQSVIYYAIGLFLIKIVPVCIVLFMGYTLYEVIWSLCISGLVSFFIAQFLLFPFYTLRVNKKVIQGFLFVGLGFILYGIMGIIPHYVDAIIVNHFYRETEIYAIFRYGSKDVPFIGALTSGIAISALPILGKDLSVGLSLLKSESTKLLKWFLPLTVGLIIFSPLIFEWVYTPEYRYSGFIFSLMLLTIIPRIIFAQTIYMHLGWTRSLIMISLAEMILNIVFSLVLVKPFGLLGILGGTVLAFFFEKIWMVSMLYRKKIILDKYLSVPRLIIFFTISIIVWISTFLFYNPTLL